MALVEESHNTFYDTIEGHWGWWVRNEGHFVQIPAHKKAACDQDVKHSLSDFEIEAGIPYTIHLVGEWRELFEQVGCASVFLSSEWMTTWWQHRGGTQRLLVVTVRLPSGCLITANSNDQGRIEQFLAIPTHLKRHLMLVACNN